MAMTIRRMRERAGLSRSELVHLSQDGPEPLTVDELAAYERDEVSPSVALFSWCYGVCMHRAVKHSKREAAYD